MEKTVKKILVLYTGGTIGMEPSDEGFVPMHHFDDFFEKALSAQDTQWLPDFDFKSLDDLIDSANLMPMNWTIIGTKLLDLWSNYQGFVVLHGTGTMAYTASALSFMFQGQNKPVVLTGSQVPMTQANSDALNNVIQACKVAVSEINEVSICFDGKILRGNRSTKVNSFAFDAFNSPNLPWLGAVSDTVETKPFLTLPKKSPDYKTPTFDCDAVLVLQVYPGISAQAFEGVFTNNSFKAIVLKTYGAGNTPNVDSSLIRILKRASADDIIVVNITQCMVGGVEQSTYATGNHMLALGVVSGGDMTLEATFTKLHFLIAAGYNTAQIKQKLTEPLAGELTCQ